VQRNELEPKQRRIALHRLSLERWEQERAAADVIQGIQGTAVTAIARFIVTRFTFRTRQPAGPGQSRLTVAGEMTANGGQAEE